MRDSIIYPFEETAQQVFARISALRDHFDGPQVYALFDLHYLYVCKVEQLHNACFAIKFEFYFTSPS